MQDPRPQNNLQARAWAPQEGAFTPEGDPLYPILPCIPKGQGLIMGQLLSHITAKFVGPLRVAGTVVDQDSPGGRREGTSGTASAELPPTSTPKDPHAGPEVARRPG